MAGLQKIKIPYKPNEITEEIITRVLPNVFNAFIFNAGQIRADYDTYLLQHDILSKKRLHDDSETNNIVLEPHIFNMVSWKSGYVMGNPIKYAQTKSLETDDIQQLNIFLKDSDKRTIDKEVAVWSYATGVGYYFIEPKSEDYNKDTEAPFVLYAKDSDTCTKIYSTYNGNPPLFDLLYTSYADSVIDSETNRIKEINVDVVSIYTKDYFYEFENSGGGFLRTRAEKRGIYKMLPLVEKKWHSNGIGIVAMGEALQNGIDKISSNVIDNIDDVVNEIYAYFNVSLGKNPEEAQQNHRDMKKNGAVILNTNSGSQHPADLKLLSTKLDFSAIVEVKQNLTRTMYDTIGVPTPSSNTNSGGTTKQGSEVANGYDNAYNKALDDINSFIVGDNELLKRIIFICKAIPDSKINDLSAGEIEIKYALNMTDNMLTKTQSYVNLVTNGMPPALALEKCRMSYDTEAEGKMIETFMKAHNIIIKSEVAEKSIVDTENIV